MEGLSRRDFFKKTGKGLVGLVAGGGILHNTKRIVLANGSAEGDLKIENYVDSKAEDLDIVHMNGTCNESLWIPPQPGDPSIYSLDNGQKLFQDCETPSEYFQHKIALTFNGTPSNPENYLEFSFPYGKSSWGFGSQPIKLYNADASWNSTGFACDVRDRIDNHSGRFDLDDLDSPPYSPSIPYKRFLLDIGQNPNTIPTLSEYGMMIMGAGLLGAYAFMNRKNKLASEKVRLR